MTEMFWFLSPHKDKKFQWWWGLRKVTMTVLPEEEKTKYLERINVKLSGDDRSRRSTLPQQSV